MNQFIIDAAVIGSKEALKLAFVWYVCRAFFDAYGRAGLMRYFYFGVAVASGLFVLSFFIPHDMAARETVARLTGYVFFLFFMAALALMYDPPHKMPGGVFPLEPVVVFAATALYFSPDIVGASLYVRELAVLSERASGIYLPAVGAFIVSLALMAFVLRRPVKMARSFLGPAEVFVFLALVKFLGGGTKGFSEISLVSSVQQGLVKFVHDAVHQSLLFLMVPDHSLLMTTTWNFIGFFFSDPFTAALALLILAGPMLAFLYVSLTGDIPIPEAMHSGAERRMYRAEKRAFRRRRAVMSGAFALVVFVSWYSVGGGRAGTALELPEPRPVVPESGVVSMDLSGPGFDLMDGRLYKFSVNLEGETVVLLAIRKPDGKLAVALDACEICPPEGYGRSEGYVVCVFCMTPIPIETLGMPGGCNPIPLEAEITDSSVIVRMDEIARKWRFVTSGKSREGIR